MRKFAVLGLVVALGALTACAPANHQAQMLDYANEVLQDCADKAERLPTSDLLRGGFASCPFGTATADVVKWNVGNYTASDCAWDGDSAICRLNDVDISLTNSGGTWGDASDFAIGELNLSVQNGEVWAYVAEGEYGYNSPG